VSQKTVANLGWDKIRLTAPVFAGDTIYAESEVIGKRESGSRPHHGIVTVRTTGEKSRRTAFMTFERSALIPMRGHAVDDGWITRLVFLALAAATSPAQAQAPIVVGAVVSQTGLNADLAADYRKALKLWRPRSTPRAGSSDGRSSCACSTTPRRRRASRSSTAGYRRGARAAPHRAYGSAATRAAAGEAERERRVMVNPAGPARVAQEGAARWVFQTSAPYAAYGAGVLALAREQGFTRLQIFARDEFATREMAEETRLAALALGFAVPEVEPYSLMTVDFAPHVARAAAAQAQAWLAFGEVRDAGRDGEDLQEARLLRRGSSSPARPPSRASCRPSARTPNTRSRWWSTTGA